MNCDPTGWYLIGAYIAVTFVLVGETTWSTDDP